MINRPTMLLTALVLLAAGPSFGQPAPPPPDAKTCEAETRRLAEIAARVKIEVTAPAKRQMFEPVRVRISGLGSPPKMEGQLKFVSAVSDVVAIKQVTGLFSVEGQPESGAPPRWMSNLKRVAYYWYERPDAHDAVEFLFWASQPGPLEITTAAVASTPCGERPVGEVRTHAFVFEPDRREALFQTPSHHSCDKQVELLKPLAAGFTVKIERDGVALKNNSEIKAGEPFTIAWKRGSEPFMTKRPAYLIFSTYDWVRFEGRDILPIPPNGRMPWGIPDMGLMRVFVPLSTPATPESGTFTARAHRTGSLSFTWAVVSSDCGVFAEDGVLLNVAPGAPKVVVQDFFSLEKPEKVIVANGGKHRLEVFKASYRVFDITTGVKIVDRAGRSPNFSPGARFVAAYASGNEHIGGFVEIIDLVTGEPVPRLGLQGPIIAWALGDALLIDGTQGHPEFRVRRSLVDPSFFKPYPSEPDRVAEANLIEGSLSGRGSSAWERFQVKLLLDQGLITIADRLAAPTTRIFEIASGAPMTDDRLSADEARTLLASRGVANWEPPETWDMGEPLKLSHFSPALDERLPDLLDTYGENGEKVADGPDLPKQRVYHVEHTGTPLSPEQQLALRDPLDDAPVTRTADWRTRVAGRERGAAAAGPAQFAQQLAGFGICAQPGCNKKSKVEAPRSLVTKSTFFQSAFQYGSQSTTFTVPPEDIETALAKDVPAAKALMTGVEPNKVCYQDENPIPRFRVIPDEKGHTDVHGVWNWTIGDKRFWLVQAVCSHAGILGSPLLLFVGSQGSQGEVVVLDGSSAAGTDENGLHKDFDGSPSEVMLRVRPAIVDGKWLLIAAPAGSSAAIIDLQAPGSPVFVRGLKDVYAVAHLFRSEDGKHLVQLNTDGRFHVHKTGGSGLVISGRWIDDEMVLVTGEGYYDGSYEGGHFVHLAFAGEPGLYSLAQFEKVLKRPDIVKSVLAGTIKDGPAPVLAVPPRASVGLESGGQAVTLRLAARAGLRSVRLFEDGQLLEEVGLSGRELDKVVPLKRPLDGRWLSAIAEDATGLLSAPGTIALAPPATTERKLHAVLVGIDKYRETHLDVTYARSDAVRLAGALRAARGGYYSSVEAAELLDGEATPGAIIGALEAAIARAKPGDTVLFSFAGHGLRGKDGRFYLSASGFSTGDAAATGLAWSKISAAIDRSKSRVVVILDACHSGATGSEGVVTNDDAAAELLKGSRAPVLVFAASKGRQFSYEDGKGGKPRWNGGVFTYALAKALSEDWEKADANGNRALEVSELYRAVKGLVSEETKGKQTPWLVRQDLVGDFAVF